MKTIFVLSGIIFFICSNMSAQEQETEVSDLWKKAQSTYNENNQQEAIALLQDLIDAIKAEIAQNMTVLLPDNMVGWTRLEVDASAPNDPFSSIMPQNESKPVFDIRAKYKSEIDETHVLVSITNISHKVQMEQAQIDMLFNPMFQEAMQKPPPPNIEKIELHGCTGVLEFQSESNQVNLKLFGYDSMIKIECFETQDEKTANLFAAAVNWEKLKAVNNKE